MQQKVFNHYDLIDGFINHQSNHKYNTRNKDDYQFHMFRLNTVLNTGPKIWNNVPKHIKCSNILGQF